MTFDLQGYLRRIHLDGAPQSLKGLFALQRAQLLNIPFENIDPLLGRIPELARDHVFRKLVQQKRGGYCFELNGLLGQVLQALGFVARPVLARVRADSRTRSQPRSLLSIARLNIAKSRTRLSCCSRVLIAQM